jgi:hypothetical protein
VAAGAVPLELEGFAALGEGGGQAETEQGKRGGFGGGGAGGRGGNGGAMLKPKASPAWLGKRSTKKTSSEWEPGPRVTEAHEPGKTPWTPPRSQTTCPSTKAKAISSAPILKETLSEVLPGTTKLPDSTAAWKPLLPPSNEPVPLGGEEVRGNAEGQGDDTGTGLGHEGVK